MAVHPLQVLFEHIEGESEDEESDSESDPSDVGASPDPMDEDDRASKQRVQVRPLLHVKLLNNAKFRLCIHVHQQNVTSAISTLLFL